MQVRNFWCKMKRQNDRLFWSQFVKFDCKCARRKNDFWGETVWRFLGHSVWPECYSSLLDERLVLLWIFCNADYHLSIFTAHISTCRLDFHWNLHTFCLRFNFEFGKIITVVPIAIQEKQWPTNKKRRAKQTATKKSYSDGKSANAVPNKTKTGNFHRKKKETSMRLFKICYQII